MLPADPGASGYTSRRAVWGVPSKDSSGRKMSLLPPQEPSQAWPHPLVSDPHPLAAHWNHMEPKPRSRPIKPKKSGCQLPASAFCNDSPSGLQIIDLHKPELHSAVVDTIKSTADRDREAVLAMLDTGGLLGPA